MGVEVDFTVSVTEREDFRRCRRMWDYKSSKRQGLQPIVQGMAFSLGNLVHSSLAEWTKLCYTDDGYRKAIEPPSLNEIFLKQAVLLMDTAQSVYRQKVGVKPNDSELSPIYEAIDLGKEMMTNYQAVHKWPYGNGWSVYSVEATYTAPVDTITQGTYLIDTYIKGKVDAVIRDPNGDGWVVEHKTYSIRPREATLDSNNQFLAYIWLVRQRVQIPIRGIAYDGLWKKSKPSKSEPYDSLFCRMLLERPERELEEFENMLNAEINDMVDPYMYINRRWEGCNDCAYDRLCRAQSKGDDTESIIEQNFVRGESNGEKE